MDNLSIVAEKVNSALEENWLNTQAHTCGFIKRKRKITAKQFLLNLILLRLAPLLGSLGDLALEFKKQDCDISKPALHKKFNCFGVSFLKCVLNDLLAKVTRSPSTFLSDIPFIENAVVADSAIIRLNKKLNTIHPEVRGKGATLKLQALLELLSQQVFSLDLRPAKEPDQKYRAHLDYIKKNYLYIADLGYYCVDTFRKVMEKDAFFLSRFLTTTKIYSDNLGQAINLSELLNKTYLSTLDMQIKLGATKLFCRYVAIRMPEKGYQKRLNKLRAKIKSDKRSKIKLDDEVHKWTIFVTNLPISVPPLTLLKIYSLRWQIELFFKTLKSFFNLRVITSSNDSRAQMSLYVSLIAIVLLTMIVMTIKNVEISEQKAGKLFSSHIREFIELLRESAEKAISWMSNLLRRCAVKDSRKERPSTRESLGLRPRFA